MYSSGIMGLNTPNTVGMGQDQMYPGSQQIPAQYATPSQTPISSSALNASYEPKTDPYTGEMKLAGGGIAALRYDEGGDVQQVEAPLTTNPAPPPTMDELAAQLNQAYRTNQNYDDIWKQFAATKDQDPQQWYRNQLGFLGGQQGWQIGQNTSERNAAGLPAIQDTVAQAKAAGLSEDEIGQILNNSSQNARNANVQRIAQDAAANKTGGLGGMVVPAATMAAMVLAPELAPFLVPELGAFGGALASGAITGGAIGGIGAGVSGGDIGKGVLMGGATGAAGAGLTSGLGGLDLGTVGDTGIGVSDALKGIKTANSIYNVGKSGGQNLSADINAFKGIASMAPTTSAAKGGVMYSSGGIGDLGGYSDGGRLLKGPGDGMSDHIPATIGGKQPARLADGEFVIPADVVSHLGNGSTDAGAKHLYKMMDKIRKARTGNPKQGKQINANKFLPRN